MAVRKKTTLKIQDTTLRLVWLACLGVAVSARREVGKATGDASIRIASLKQRASEFAGQAQTNLRGGIASMREQGESRAHQFSAEVETRLAPVLAKLGIKPQPVKASRTRKTTKKVPAKRVLVRKAAAKRTARKARA